MENKGNGKNNDNNNLTKINFSKLYIEELKQSYFQPLSSSFWDDRAQKFTRPIATYSSFITTLLPKLRVYLDGCNSVLDIGCGSGEILSLLDGISVKIGIDSSLQMVNLAKIKLGTKGVIKKVSWDDDWKDIPKTDAVMSIRSLQYQDPDIVISKMLDKAKKICIVVTRCKSHLSDQIMELIPFKMKSLPPSALLFGIFENLGYYPFVDYIETTKIQNIGCKEDRDALADDIIKRVNSIKWDETLINKLKNNIELRSLKSSEIVCDSKWGIFVIRK